MDRQLYSQHGQTLEFIKPINFPPSKTTPPLPPHLILIPLTTPPNPCPKSKPSTSPITNPLQLNSSSPPLSPLSPTYPTPSPSSPTFPTPSLSAFNHVIRGLTQTDSPSNALLVFSQMRRFGLGPSKLTYPFVLKSCAHLSSVKIGMQVHSDCLKRGLDSVVYVQNTLMLLYGSCRLVGDARKVFDEMSHRTVVSGNTILSVYNDNLLHVEAIGLFAKMIFDGFEADQTTFVVMLSAAAELGSLRFGKWIHGQVILKEFGVNVQLGTSIINMYAKCGDLIFASCVFDRMVVKNVWTWSAMIVGLAQHGSAREALRLFTKMKKSSVKPNDVTFLGVLCACSHAGLVNEGYKFFQEMVHAYGIKPMMTHYSAMVDVLGRKGHLNEAYYFMKRMPIDPDSVVWRTLLSACQLHIDKDLQGIGEKVRKRLLKLEPERCGNYVMVANMFSESGSWKEAAKVRRVMREEGMKKTAGESRIEVGRAIHKFVSGDDYKGRGKCVHHLLDGLKLNMKVVEKDTPCLEN